MKKLEWLISIFCALILSGCSCSAYSVQDWLEDACEKMGYHDSTIIDYWQDLLKIEHLNKQLTCHEAAIILCDVLGEEQNNPCAVMVNLGYFEQINFNENKPIFLKEAQSLLEKAEDDLSQRTFISSKTEMTLNQNVMGSVDNLGDLLEKKNGIYELDGYYYQVTENGEYTCLSLDEVISTLDIETTFQPNLEEGIIFPDGTTFQSDIEGYNTLFQNASVDFLKSKYFSFKIGNYKVNGRVYANGLEVNCKRYDFHDMTLENHLNLSNLKITADVSMNPFKDPHFFLRQDYHLQDTMSLSKQKTQNLKKKELSLEMLSDLKIRLASLVKKQSEEVTGDLELLRFSFPVPGTLDTLHLEMVLRLRFLLNGETCITFEADQHYGMQSSANEMIPIKKKSWSVEPYLEGSAELACNIGLDLMLGKYLLADISLESGIGAQGSTSVYFVNKKEKTVEKQEMDSQISDLQIYIDQFQPSKEVSIDLCGDIDVYCFARINVGNSKDSLLNKIGIRESYTPIKENVSVLHIENHRVVASCTRKYEFNDKQEIENKFQLSSYQLILKPGDIAQLTIEDNNDDDIYQWQTSQPEIVKVTNGQIEAIKSGTALVTVKNNQGHENACVVIVLKEDAVTFEPLSSFF